MAECSNALLARLQGLQVKFKNFRRENGLNCKVPTDLREEVFRCLEDGVRVCDLIKTLGISSSSISSWRQHRNMDSTMVRPAPQVRVLDVTPINHPSGLKVSYEAGRWMLEISF